MNFDAIVVGAGAAGLSAALRVAYRNPVATTEFALDFSGVAVKPLPNLVVETQTTAPRRADLSNSFEDYCWRDVVPCDVLQIYRAYERTLRVGDRPALLAIDLYRLTFAGGSRPVLELQKDHPSSCGEYAWAALPHLKRLMAGARAAGLPIIYSTQDTRPEAKPRRAEATKRRTGGVDSRSFEIQPELAPAADDLIVSKQRASVFFGTPLIAHLLQLGVDSLIVCGESTSGCVRASVVDAFSHGFHVTVVEEGCFDRSLLSHKINLFDMHHKYADVMHLDDVLAALKRRSTVAAVA